MEANRVYNFVNIIVFFIGTAGFAVRQRIITSLYAWNLSLLRFWLIKGPFKHKVADIE